jgi:hypothetical protein
LLKPQTHSPACRHFFDIASGKFLSPSVENPSGGASVAYFF